MTKEELFNSLGVKMQRFIPTRPNLSVGYPSDLDRSGFANVQTGVMDAIDDVDPLLNWCQDRFGDNWIWSRMNDWSYKFWFIDPECATMFKLRWS